MQASSLATLLQPLHTPPDTDGLYVCTQSAHFITDTPPRRAAYSCVRVCMEVYGSVIWRIEMSERVLVWSACCVYGPAKSIHSSSQPLNGKSAWWMMRRMRMATMMMMIIVMANRHIHRNLCFPYHLRPAHWRPHWL